jgi:hypothetical protein
MVRSAALVLQVALGRLLGSDLYGFNLCAVTTCRSTSST